MLKNLFSLSGLATALTAAYLWVAVKNLSRLMYPLSGVDMTAYPPSQLVRPLWGEGSGPDRLGMKVYLSTRPQFTLDFLMAEYGGGGGGAGAADTVLLWEEPDAAAASLTRSFVLSAAAAAAGEEEEDASFRFAAKWLDDAEEKRALEKGGAGVVTAMANAGEGIESASVLLSLYQAASGAARRLGGGGEGGESGGSADSSGGAGGEAPPPRAMVPIPPTSPIWRSLVSNSTVHVHVLLTRGDDDDAAAAAAATGDPAGDVQNAALRLRASFQAHNSLLGQVDVVKWDVPNHIAKPRRVLYHDLIYVLRRYVLRTADESEPRPWDMSLTKPEEFERYERAQSMKEEGVGYSYWKPEVSVKLVSDDLTYPGELVGASGMEVVQLSSARPGHDSSYAYLPGLIVDEIGLTSEKYIALNGTVTALPLRISFDRNDVGTKDEAGSSSGLAQGGLSPARWRLLSHLSDALEAQKDLGFEQSDIDDLRRLIAETNVTLLAITILASTLHLLFEFLTFKTDIEFWRGNKDLTGLSVRALYMDFISQFIILLYLIEMDSSLLMTLPSAAGVLIALWKCQRGSGLKFVRAEIVDTAAGISFYNKFFRLFGYELSATRLKITDPSKAADTKNIGGHEAGGVDLVALSIETDALATRTLGKYVLLPIVLGYTLHSLITEQHPGWYSWLIVTASSAVYAVGFVMMTPQLFLNYKLKSVAHLPWKVLGFRFVNTFIDDLFAFIIRMPTMARISCFRDDIVFIIYLYQRWLYPVDTSRPVEGGGMDAISAAAATEASTSSTDAKEKKKNQ